MEINSIPARLPGSLTIFKQAWLLYKQRFGTFVGVAVVPMLVMAAFGLLSAAGGFLAVARPTLGSLGVLLFLGLVLFIASLIIFPWGIIALLYAVKDSAEMIGVGAAFRRAWGKIRSYYWITLLVTFIIVGGLILLVVPGIIFMVWFGFAIFVLIDEGLKGMDALLKSREYVRGQWWAVLGRLFVMWLVTVAVAIVQSIIFSIVENGAVREVIQFLIYVFLTPFFLSYVFLLYQHLKVLKGANVGSVVGNQKTTFTIIAVLGVVLPILLGIWFSLGSIKMLQ